MRAASRLLLYVGIVGGVFALASAHAGANGYSILDTRRLVSSAGYAIALCLAAYAFGLPDLRTARRGALLASLLAAAGAALAVSVVQLVVGDALLPRFVVFGAAALTIPWALFVALLAAGDRAQSFQDRIFFVGDLSEHAALTVDVLHSVERPMRVVGHLAIDDACGPLPSAPLEAAVREASANVLVLSRSAQVEESVVHQAAALHERGVRVRTLSLFYEQWLGKLPVSELERFSLMFDISELHRAVYSRASRLLDLVVAVPAALVLATAIPFVVIGNVVANRGPLFYRQPRVGKNNTEFIILKFRTMRPGAGGSVTEWTATDDPRVTPFGGLLRRMHVDELPQVINILRGNISVVGPRPEQPHYVEELAEKLPFYNLRHLVRPGLTGWAQVKYGYAGSEFDALEKLQYEFFYLRHQSLRLDLVIILRTLRSVLGLRGR